MELIHKQKTCYEIYKDHEDKIDGFALDYIDFF